MLHHEPAPIKLNLALQIVARQLDGYHQLDSIVVFLEHGDALSAEVHPDEISLHIKGEFASHLAQENNLVLRAARLLREKAKVAQGATLTLQKNIPVGAGLGGGSADAAAALRLLNRLWNCQFTLESLAEIAIELGADVPVCVLGYPARMQGIGEKISPLPSFPPLQCLVVYPASPLWTADVFRALKPQVFSGALEAGALKSDASENLANAQNDLQTTAIILQPAIKPLLEKLEICSGALFARMSGSGSACYALFEDAQDAQAAKNKILLDHPGYWVLHSRLA